MQIREQVIQFMSASQQSMPHAPTNPTDERLRLRVSLILEEAFELMEACLAGDNEDEIEIRRLKNLTLDLIDHEHTSIKFKMADVADALADLDYVVEGARLAFGIDGKPIADAVHKANMEKFGPGAWVRDDGKQMKPPDWKPADISGLLKEQGWEPTRRTSKNPTRSNQALDER